MHVDATDEVAPPRLPGTDMVVVASRGSWHRTQRHSMQCWVGIGGVDHERRSER